MYRIVIIIALVITLSGCRQKILHVENVEAIKVTVMTKRQHGKVYHITDKQQIAALVAIAQKGQRDPNQFKSTYRVEFISANEVQTMLVKSDKVKVDGLSYRLDENLGQRITSIIKAERED